MSEMEDGIIRLSADQDSTSCDEGIFDTDLLSRLRTIDEPLGQAIWPLNVSAALRRDEVPETVKKINNGNNAAEPPTALARFKTDNTGTPRLTNKLYLPLGTLTYASVVPTEKLDLVWRETISLPDALSKDNSVSLPLSQLLTSSWIRIQTRKCQQYQELATTRVYVLPDDRGLSVFPKAFRKHRQALRVLMESLDNTSNAWDGLVESTTPLRMYSPKQTEDDSLFYMFNTLRSPLPDPRVIDDAYMKEIIGGLMEGLPTVPGLKTELYPYQRRSAAMMIQREVKPARMLDPRLETLCGPTSEVFYFDREACVLLSNRCEYDEACGGILAETMGYGKTLICLAAILQTKGNWPQIPPQFSLGLRPVRSRVGSLMQMAAATIGRNSVPWKSYFERLAREGDYFQECVKSLNENAASYVIPDSRKKSARNPEVRPRGKTILLSSTTLIIVPPNLVGQWLQEISLHLEQGSLSIFVIDNLHQPIPPASELRNFDIILISKYCFERESSSHNATLEAMKKETKCRCPRRFCQCSIDAQPYHSPLKDLHFLRLVVDEGHAFASTGATGNAGSLLNDLHVERKWIISGTPTSGLMGVEIDMAAVETQNGVSNNGHEASQKVLAARRKEIAITQERKDLEKLGNIVVNFLHLKPWAKNVKAKDDEASWRKYVITSGPGMRKITSLKATLEGLVVRHSVGDLEADLALPSLYNRVVHLDPCRFDKLSINLFNLVLTVNAITSERVDQDYIFHRSNRKQLDQLVRNLMQSGFYWTGFSTHEVSETVRLGQDYLSNPDKHVSQDDRKTLDTAVRTGLLCLESPSWRALSQLAEIGLSIKDFPEDAVPAWSLFPDRNMSQLLTGATQLQIAQNYVKDRVYATNPAEGLVTTGIAVMAQLWNDAQTISGLNKSKHDSLSKQKPRSEASQVIPASITVAAQGFRTKPISAYGGSIQRTAAPSPIKPGQRNANGLKSALKSTSMFQSHAPAALDLESPLNRTILQGTASAKLSYLLDRIAILHDAEKIIVFYEGDHIAWYIAQCLELIHVQHLIYAKGTALTLRASYLEWFNTTDTYRVLLMDVRQAAHGLNVASASRIFFVNPVWSPSVEAQAIKRAHRIGQTRPVYVETLVLKNTFEEQLLGRRKAMTTDEHQQAAKSILDDTPMNNMIQNLAFIPLSDREGEDQLENMAPLRFPQPVFGSAAIGACEKLSDVTMNPTISDADGSNLPDRRAFELELRETSVPVATFLKQRKVASVTFEARKVDITAQVLPKRGPDTQVHKRKAGFAPGLESSSDSEEMRSKRRKAGQVSFEPTNGEGTTSQMISSYEFGLSRGVNHRGVPAMLNDNQVVFDLSLGIPFSENGSRSSGFQQEVASNVVS